MKVLFGNDGELFLYNDKNEKFAEAESFSAEMINETLRTPAHFIGAEITVNSRVRLTLHGITITDEDTVERMEKSALCGTFPVMNFRGCLRRTDEIRESVVFRNLQQINSIAADELKHGYVGVWAFWVNDPKAMNYFK